MSDAKISITEEFQRLHDMRIVRYDAQRFLCAFQLLQKDNKENSTAPQPSGHADIVNLTFSIELFLKSLSYAEGVKPPKGRDGHNLQKVFDSLPETIRAEIKKEFNNWFSTKLGFGGGFEYSNFDEMLKAHANSYQDWRYWFDSGRATRSFNYQFCENLAHVLAEIAEAYEKRLLAIAIKQHKNGEIKGIQL